LIWPAIRVDKKMLDMASFLSKVFIVDEEDAETINKAILLF
jgi:hypothetical protein